MLQCANRSYFDNTGHIANSAFPMSIILTQRGEEAPRATESLARGAADPEQQAAAGAKFHRDILYFFRMGSPAKEMTREYRENAMKTFQN